MHPLSLGKRLRWAGKWTSVSPCLAPESMTPPRSFSMNRQGSRLALAHTTRHPGPSHSRKCCLELSVRSGIEDKVPNPVRPIRTVHFGNPTDPLAECPTGSPSLSQQTLGFEEIRVTCHPDTEFNAFTGRILEALAQVAA